MTTEQQLSAVEKEAQVLELCKAGWGFRQIAQQLGYAGPSSAHHAFKRAMQKTIQLPADEYRKLQLEQYGQLWKVTYPMALRGDLRAVNQCVKIAKAIADLLGLNAPKEVKLSHELTSMADRVAEGLSLNAADVLAEAERILTASGTVD